MLLSAHLRPEFFYVICFSIYVLCWASSHCLMSLILVPLTNLLRIISGVVSWLRISNRTKIQGRYKKSTAHNCVRGSSLPSLVFFFSSWNLQSMWTKFQAIVTWFQNNTPINGSQNTVNFSLRYRKIDKNLYNKESSSCLSILSLRNLPCMFNCQRIVLNV